MHVPSSLAAKVLKAMYFKDRDILDTSTKYGCSHLWRSLGWGRELLSKGLRWTMGDGECIRVFKDQWIPRPSTFKPITCDLGLDIRVAALIDRSRRGWNSKKLNQLLIPMDTAVILAIPVSWSSG
ncbi:hypothetical protein Dsin_001148 [Dipteronia sinensis]|uniref:Reverse transcriptase n=1 Tax=Dipteronia sinensis TaxID=43782 RepID=A0AAE0EIR1_9ROSI|nr:hypothetical protein Dsin_001148 [Dipteronia sinensis]